jgi:predicted RNA polymerase sigma factor
MSAALSDAWDADFVDAVARRVVELLRAEGVATLEGPRLLTVAAVSAEFGVSIDWVYANARALGAIRLGSGPRARLRFDRATIMDRIAKVATNASRQRSSPRASRRRGTRETADGDLLPILGNGA